MFFEKKFSRKYHIGIAVDKKRKEVLYSAQRMWGIRFSNLALLNLALAHKSYTNENKLSLNNERLEFLGDSVLGIIIADQLYRVCNEKKEGYLAKCKAHIVSEKILNQIAQTLKLDSFLLIGRGEELSGGREKSAIVSDALEAVIGAYYLDKDFKHAHDFVLRIFQDEISAVLKNEHSQDYKTLLQEYVQQNFKMYPVYKIITRSGPEHKQIFWSTVEVAGTTYGPASGTNKKDAEQAVAEIAYRCLLNADNKNTNVSARMGKHTLRKAKKKMRASQQTTLQSTNTKKQNANRKRGGAHQKVSANTHQKRENTGGKHTKNTESAKKTARKHPAPTNSKNNTDKNPNKNRKEGATPRNTQKNQTAKQQSTTEKGRSTGTRPIAKSKRKNSAE